MILKNVSKIYPFFPGRLAQSKFQAGKTLIYKQKSRPGAFSISSPGPLAAEK